MMPPERGGLGTSMSNTLSRLMRFQIGQPTKAQIAIRAIVGSVFLASGLLKFLFVAHGPGRFEHIGLPFSEPLAYFVGLVEIVCGSLLILGLLTRLATIPLMIDMVTALATTKVPLVFGYGAEKSVIPPHTGFWAAVYQGRLDVTMLVSCAYLLVVGAGLWSLDWRLSRRRDERHPVRDITEGARIAARA